MPTRSQRRLERIFHAAASTLGTLGMASLSGCATDLGAADPARFTLPVCDGAGHRRIAGITPGVPVDYLELRSEGAKEGTVCKTATKPAKCAEDFGNVSTTEGGWTIASADHSTTEYLVFTRGDAVGAVTSVDALGAFLAPIDNPKDAALLVSALGHRIVCEGNAAREVDGGYEILTQTGYACGAGTHLDQNAVRVSRSGAVEVIHTVRIKDGDRNCSVGRRPEGLVADARGGDGLGAYLAQMSRLEAASVYAFDQLARELRAHGSPLRLVRAATRARADEIRHAKVTARLAIRAGGTVIAPVIVEQPVRSLLAIAVENVVEGCVRETFGALVAKVQAAKAEDSLIARAMRVIARDETRHAALAWDVAEWIAPRLNVGERAAVEEARRQALRSLRREIAIDPTTDVRILAGMPSADEAAKLFDALFDATALGPRDRGRDSARV